jgi:hypothetical protein
MMYDMDLAMNDSMAPIYEGMLLDSSPATLPPHLAAVADAGLRRSGDRVLLANPQITSPPPPHLDDWSAEQWTNEILLDSRLPATDPVWRTELVGWGVAIAEALLHAATGLADLPIQVVVSLQSAPGAEDPEANGATGAIHVYCVRLSADDAATRVAEYDQPVLVLTVR